MAARMAKEAINKNATILRDYNINLLAHDGQCSADMVMKRFIDYIVHKYYENLVGVLGPACSETVEPLAGVSKHYKTLVISYSAEGTSFSDRTKYPYFFRTIGENKQYILVYQYLLKKMGWKRIAALSEDGQKYTEYISHMQALLEKQGTTFIANIKFPRERTKYSMKRVSLTPSELLITYSEQTTFLKRDVSLVYKQPDALVMLTLRPTKRSKN